MTLPAIILTNPQMGENIGGAARAMLNFSLTDLRIVNPRDGWPNEAAIANASGAFDIMPAPQIFDNLSGALKDIHVSYATTARPRDMVKKVFTPESASQDVAQKQLDGLNTAIIFGAERTGLTNDEIVQANHIITKKNFFRSADLKPTMLRNIRNIFTRGDLTEQEVRTMQGIISALIGNKVK